VVCAHGYRWRTPGLDALALSHALLHALWSEEKDVRDPCVRRSVAEALGFDSARLLSMERQRRDHVCMKASHDEAVENGVFGTPTYVYETAFTGAMIARFLEKLSQSE
jgi:2-hydroxychromene-2-carboxylate isomerase